MKLDISYPASCQRTKDSELALSLTCETVHSINASFYSIIPDDLIGRTNLLAIAVRVAFHDAGEGDLQQPNDKLGSDGCLSNDSDNAGLIEDTSLVMTQIEGLWQTYCDKISRADFWVLTAKLALAASTNNFLNVPFQYGRVDAKSCAEGTDRLPGGQYHLQSTANYFKSQLDLDISDAGIVLHTFMYTYIHTCIYTYISYPENIFYVFIKVSNPNRTNTLVDLQSVKYTYIHTYMHAYIYSYIHTRTVQYSTVHNNIFLP